MRCYLRKKHGANHFSFQVNLWISQAHTAPPLLTAPASSARPPPTASRAGLAHRPGHSPIRDTQHCHTQSQARVGARRAENGIKQVPTQTRTQQTVAKRWNNRRVHPQMNRCTTMACPHDGILRGHEKGRSPDPRGIVDEPGDRMPRAGARHEDPPLRGHIHRTGPGPVSPQGQSTGGGSCGLGGRRMRATP